MESDELSLLKKLIVLWNSRRLILFLTIISGIVSGIYAFYIPPVYKAECYFLPPNQDMNRISSLSGNMMNNMMSVTPERVGGVADLAGLPTTVTGGQMVLGILKRNVVLDEIIERFALMEIYEQEYKSRMREKLLKDILETTEDPKSGIISVSVLDEDPNRASEMANALVEVLQAKMLDLSLNEAVQRRIFFEGQVEKSREALNKAEAEMLAYQEESGSAIPESQLQARLRSITELQQQIIAKNSEISALLTYAREDNPKVKAARSQLETLTNELAKLESEQRSSTPQLSVEYQRYAMNLHLATTAYEVVLKQYENAKIDEAQGFFPLQVVDYATPPDFRYKPSRSKMILIGMFLGMLIGCMIAVFGEFRENMKVKFQEYAPQIERKKSLLPFTFLIISTALIFFLTFQSKLDTEAVSGKFQGMLMSFFENGYIPEWVNNMIFLRAFAHFPLYFFLSVCAFTSFYLYGMTLGRSLAISLVLSSCIGLLDETVKIFIPGREFDIVDWVIDIAGIISGGITSAIVTKIFGRWRNEESD